MYLLVAGTLALAYVIYRQLVWYFSPFRSIPTPFEYPVLAHNPYFYIGKKDTLNTFKAWAEEFKEFGIFRFKTMTILSEYAICLLKPENYKFVLSRPDIFRRTSFFRKYFPLAGDGLLTSHGSLHQWQKKSLSKMFSMTQTKYYIPVFNKHMDVMIQIWNSLVQKNNHKSANIEIKKYSSDLSFDIIGETAFGYHFNTQTKSVNKFTKVIRDKMEGVIDFKSILLLKIFPFLKYAPFGPAQILENSEKCAERVLKETPMELHNFDRSLGTVLQNRMDRIRQTLLTEEEKNDFLSILMNTKDEKTGQCFSEALIKSNAYTFMIAGHETTASTVPGVLYYMAKFPAYQEKCREEILNLVTVNEELTFDHLSKLPLTAAFLKEALRLFTPVPIADRISTRSVVINGHEFPKGTHFFLPPFIANEDQMDFDDAHLFRPERYLDDDDNKKLGVSFTFGYGPYSCIGKHFAMQELKVIVVRLLQNFKFTIDPECEQFYRKVKITLLFIPPLKIRVHGLH